MSKKYFGTDGFRGVANRELTPEHAYKIGRFLGHKSKEYKNIYIGKDTRISGDMLEAALIAGILSSGANVKKLGVISTPGVAYLTRVESVDYGVMISASHNPVQDNGIKIFKHNGYKLTDEEELEIEEYLTATDDTIPRPVGDKVGRMFEYSRGVDKYLNFLKETVDVSYEGLHIVIDGANGSASEIAAKLFKSLGAKVTTIGCEPNGVNINDGVGSTHPEKIAELVASENADLGLAFDGDADRLIAVDENGSIVDGDHIMFIIGRYLKENNKLNNDTIVSTVMSNIGFYKACENNGLNCVQTKVGDRYVLEELLGKNYNFGGEQSGHIIFLDYNTTGDGLLSALQLVNVVVKKGATLGELASDMETYPQLLKNIKVTDKQSLLKHPLVQATIKKVENLMDGNGRVLVRPSGTEPLVRVMVEAETQELCTTYVNQIIETIKKVV